MVGDITDEEILFALKRSNGNVNAASKYVGRSTRWMFTEIKKRPIVQTTLANIRYNKQLQMAKDKNRVANKTFREDARAENAAAEYAKALYLEIQNLPKITTKKWPVAKDNRAAGILHLTDLHLNEIVDNSGGNKYDWDISSKRLQHYANQCVKYLKAHKIQNVVLCLGGDLLNSDRRLDELTCNSTNRAKATMLAAYLLSQFILDINSRGFNVKVVSVTGNESRFGMERGRVDFQATDNFDFMIDQIMAERFEKNKGVEFVHPGPDEDWNERVIKVAGNNIVLTHGDSSIAKGDQKSMQSFIGKYATQGIFIRLVIMGHIHMAFVSDWFARGGSLVGNNAYSYNALNLAGRASQNMHIVWENGNINSIKVDLQETECDGYNIADKLITYHAKSRNKAKVKTTILEIQI